MAGLLSAFEDPQTAGLLSAAAMMLQASGPSRTPTSFGQIAGTGLLAGMQGMHMAQDRQREGKMYDMKLKSLEDEMTDKQKVRDFYSNIGQFMPSQASQALALGAQTGSVGPTVENAALIDQMPKNAFNANAMYEAMVRSGSPTLAAAGLSGLSKEDESIVVGEGGSLVNKRTGQALYSNPKQEKPLELERMLDAAGIKDPLMRSRFFQQAITKQTTHAPATQVNVDARNLSTQETEQSKVYGKAVGEIRANIANAAFNAPSTMAKLNRIEELLQGVEGGGAAATGLQIAATANSLGLKLDPKLGNKEAAEALARELAGSLRQPGQGPMTDKDFENFLTQVPSLSKTAEGRRQIIATSRAKLARDIEIGKLAREYAKRNKGVIDDGFMDVVSDYVAQNPVVMRQSTSGRNNMFPDMSAIEAELARRGGR